jgi:hypothetical protein
MATVPVAPAEITNFMTRTHRNEMGQTTVELLVSTSLLVIAVSGMGYLFKAEWDRGKCAYLVFEKTHAAVTSGSAPESQDSQVQTEDLPDSVRGVALCRGTPEIISIPKLEQETAQ